MEGGPLRGESWHRSRGTAGVLHPPQPPAFVRTATDGGDNAEMANDIKRR